MPCTSPDTEPTVLRGPMRASLLLSDPCLPGRFEGFWKKTAKTLS